MARPAVRMIPVVAVTAALALAGCGSTDEQTTDPAKAKDPSATASPAATESSNGSYGY